MVENPVLFKNGQYADINDRTIIANFMPYIESRMLVDGQQRIVTIFSRTTNRLCPLFSRDRERPRTITNEANSSTITRDRQQAFFHG